MIDNGHAAGSPQTPTPSPTMMPWRIPVAVGCVLLFAGLLLLVETGVAQPVDLAINAALQPLRTPVLVAAFLWITTIGTEACRFALILSASALLWGLGDADRLRPLWVTVLGSEATTWAAKFLIERPRPVFLPGVATALSPSFPSAHSAGTAALVGGLAILVVRGPVGRAHRGAVAAVALALVGLIGFSRLYLNVHYLTDVLSGAAIGTFWLALGSSWRMGPTLLAEAQGGR